MYKCFSGQESQGKSGVSIRMKKVYWLTYSPRR